MPDAELKALGDLAGRYADEALLSPIQSVHSAVSERVFKAIGGGVGRRAPATFTS